MADEAEAAVPVDPDAVVVDGADDDETVPAVAVLPVLDTVVPDVVEVDDVTPPVDRSCPRIVSRDCSSASSADGLLLEAPDPVVDEDVEDPVGFVVAMWVDPSEAPPVDDPRGGAGGDDATGGGVTIWVKPSEVPPVDDPRGGAGGDDATGGVVAIWVEPSEASPVDDPRGGAGGDDATGGGVAMWVEPSEAPPVDNPRGGATGAPSMGGVEEDPSVEPLVPVLAATTPGAPFICSCESTARKPDEAALAPGSTGVVSDCVSVGSDRSGMDGAEPLVEAALFDWD